jgi:hypothetical protein
MKGFAVFTPKYFFLLERAYNDTMRKLGTVFRYRFPMFCVKLDAARWQHSNMSAIGSTLDVFCPSARHYQPPIKTHRSTDNFCADVPHASYPCLRRRTLRCMLQLAVYLDNIPSWQVMNVGLRWWATGRQNKSPIRCSAQVTDYRPPARVKR